MISEGACDGVERFAAYFRGFSFTPHRHDVYAVGITTTGVQSFNYRGVSHGSLAGQGFILHPDERHDGRAGDDRGFGYRIAYIDPSLIGQAVETASLPFVVDPVVDDKVLIAAIVELLESPADTDELARLCSIDALAHALVRFDRSTPRTISRIDSAGVGAARSALIENGNLQADLSELETISGMSRWQLARQFRRAYGVSPYRFHLMRRLERARELLTRGVPIAEAALVCGFADQPHLTRHFKIAYGMSPGRWRTLSTYTSTST